MPAGDPTAMCHPPPGYGLALEPAGMQPEPHSRIGNGAVLVPCTWSLLLFLPYTPTHVPTPDGGLQSPPAGAEPACTHTRGEALVNGSLSGSHIT